MRYRVLDLPTVGMGAFTPTTSTNPTASSFGLVKVTGTLGLQPVSTPKPERVWAPPISFDPATQPSNVSPDMILPSTYVAYANNMGPAADAGVGMATRRLCPLPVPAVGWIASPGQAMSTPKIAGRTTMAWPRAFQRFPVRGMRNG